MSITGYVPDNYKITASNSAQAVGPISLPYGSVVKELRISKMKTRNWSEITAPCINQDSVFNLRFRISIENIKKLLPEIILAGQVSVLFFERALTKAGFKETEFTQFIEKEKRNYGQKKTPNFFKVYDDFVEGSFCFAITKEYRIAKNKSLLNIGLRIHDVVIKFLVCDIAVYTNMNKVTGTDGKLDLRGKAANLLETLQAFWRHENVFEEKNDKKKQTNKKRIRDEDSDSFEPNKDKSPIAPLESSNKLLRFVPNEEEMPLEGPLAIEGQDPSLVSRLDSMIEFTRGSLNKMELLRQNNAPISDQQITAIARELFSSFVPLVEKPKEMIPPNLPSDDWSFDFSGINFGSITKL